MRNVALLLGLLKNNLVSKRETCKLPFSGVSISLCEKLIEKGYIASFFIDYVEKKRKTKKIVKVLLKYDTLGDNFLKSITITSSPGKRNYQKLCSLRFLDKNKKHLFLTVKGFYWSDEAQKLSLGGEKVLSID